MGNIVSGMIWLVVILVAILLIVGGIFIKILFFKWKCKFMADIVAERIREELDDIIDNLEIKMN